jgi:RNA polymerase primary sigma factor
MKSYCVDTENDSTGSDTITLYFREIGRVKLLTRQEESELAERIKQGDPVARDRMIKANLRLVVKIARGYEGLGVPLLDLISEGNIGLMKAVERYEPKKGAKLSTYSAIWIRRYITQALADQSKATRIPMNVVAKLREIRRVSARLEEELGWEPNNQELAAELQMTETRVAQIRNTTNPAVSLDAQVAGVDSPRYAETIADEKAEIPDQKLATQSDQKMLRKIIETLDCREQAVLNLRFGLDGGEARNLEETGSALNITSERARQIQVAAFLKLRCRLKKLKDRFDFARMGFDYAPSGLN